MNKKQALTMSALAALFLVACGEASSVSSSQTGTSSASSITTPSSSATTTSQTDEVITWGVVNGNFQTEVAFGTATQPGLWNVFIPTPEADGITATASYKTDSTNKYGAMNIASIDTNGKTTQWWHAQFRQNGIYLNGGGSYVLSFRVRALEARTIRVQIQGGGLTSKPTSLSELPVQIGTTWETKSINFTAPSDADNAELQFGLGPDSFLPNDLVGFARKFGEVHLDDVKIELGEPLPNTAPRISGGDLIYKTGTSDPLLVKSGLVIRDDYDRNLSLTSITALDITQGTKLNTTNPLPGFYTFLYTATDSEGLVGTHQRQIIVTDPNQLINNTQLNQFNSSGLPSGWSKWNEDNNGGQIVSTGLMPHLLPENLLGNLQNGNFSVSESFTDNKQWTTFISSTDGVVATPAINNGAFEMTTTSTTNASEFVHLQLIQTGLRLPKGTLKLSFDAKAETARTIRVALEGGNIKNAGARAINEVPTLIGTTLDNYTFTFTADNHAVGSTLRFFFGPDRNLPDGDGLTEGENPVADPTDTVDLTTYQGLTSKVTLDNVKFQYIDDESPIATLIPSISSEIFNIAESGFPWENQIKYSNLIFYKGTYRLSFKAYAKQARPVVLAMEGDGGVADAGKYNIFELTTTPQVFTFEVTFANDATNASKNLQFFMGSFSRFVSYGGADPDFVGWGLQAGALNSTDNVLTSVYFFDFSFDLITAPVA
jgi:hypothetical protein